MAVTVGEAKRCKRPLAIFFFVVTSFFLFFPPFLSVGLTTRDGRQGHRRIGVSVHSFRCTPPEQSRRACVRCVRFHFGWAWGEKKAPPHPLGREQNPKKTRLIVSLELQELPRWHARLFQVCPMTNKRGCLEMRIF